MACTYTYKGVEYTEKEIKNVLANELDFLVDSGVLQFPGAVAFYQLDQNKVKNKLIEIHDNLTLTEDGRNYLYKDIELRRVTDIIKSRQRKKFGEAADKATKDIWEEARKTGDKLHEFNHDIVNRYYNKPTIVDINKLSFKDRQVYYKLKEHIEGILKANPDSIFIPELKIADLNRKIAGTIDLLEITKDLTLNIYDYKTRSRQELHKIKLDEYSQQVKEYADILESITGLDVIKRRIIPIRVSRGQSGLEIDINEQEPVALEKTGIDELDQLLDKLHSRLDRIQSERVKPENRIAHNERVKDLQEIVKKTQLTRDVSYSINYALDEIEQIASQLDDNTFTIDHRLKEIHEMLSLYKDFDQYVPQNISKQTQDRLGELLAKSRRAERRLKKAEEEYLIRNGEKVGIIGTEATKTAKDFLAPVREANRLDRWIQGASFSEHPILQTLRRAAESQLLKTRMEFTSLRDKIKDKQKKMFDYLGENTFNPLLQENPDGSRTGKLVNKVSAQYWKEAYKAKQEGNTKWFKDNSKFDKERFEKDLNGYQEYLKTTKLEKNVKDKLISKWRNENAENWYKYHLPQEKWYDPKYIAITQGVYKGTPVEEFYNFYISTMKELLTDLPVDSIYENFIPNLKADFLERVSNVGIGNAIKSGFDFSFLEALHENPKYGIYDINNEPIDNIPILFTNELNPEDKSYDLGLLLGAFASTAYNYKNLYELEALKEASLSFVRNQSEFITTSTGEIKKSQFGQDRKITNQSITSHFGQLKDYVDVVFYGRRHATEKTKTFKSGLLDKLTAWAKNEEVEEKEYAWSKLFDSVLRFTAIKGLGFNFFAPVTSYLSAETTSFMNGVNGLYFSVTDKTKALALLAANDEKAKLIVDKYKVKMGDFEMDDLRTLSKDKINFGIQDMAFAGFHVGDYVVQNSNFIAMLLSGKHNIKWEDFEVKDGELVINKPELEIVKFRNKVTKVNKKIMGNMDKNDYASAKRYMLGRALLQFRSWLPSMFKERWGRKQYDYDLEEYVEGRYRVGFRLIIENVIKPMLGDTKAKFLNWSNLTAQEKAAVKSNILDLVIVMGVFGLLGILRGDDDDKTMMDRYSIRVLDRLLAELTFFSILPLPNVVADKYQIIISPAAAVSTVEDLIRVWDHTAKKITAEDNADPVRAIKRLAPGINQVTKLEEILTGEVNY